jgi:hypothetical protein
MYCEGKYKLTSHSKSYRLIKGVNKTIITIIEGKWIGFLESYSWSSMLWFFSLLTFLMNENHENNNNWH